MLVATITEQDTNAIHTGIFYLVDNGLRLIVIPLPVVLTELAGNTKYLGTKVPHIDVLEANTSGQFIGVWITIDC